MDRNLILRANLIKLRGIEQLTQKQFGEKINKSRSWVSLVESGVRRPNKDSLKDLAEAFHIEDVEELMRQDFKPLIPVDNENELFNMVVNVVGDAKKGVLVMQLHKERVKEIRLERVDERFGILNGKPKHLAAFISRSTPKLMEITDQNKDRFVFKFALSDQGDVISFNARPICG